MSTVGRLLPKEKMSHSYCTKILKVFFILLVSGQEDKFDPKRRKLDIFLGKGTMFSRLVTALKAGNSIEIKLYYLHHCFITLVCVFNFSPFYTSNNMLFCHMSASFKKCPQSTDNSWHRPVKTFSMEFRVTGHQFLPGV